MTIAQFFGMLAYGMGVGIVLAAPVGPINIEIIRRGLISGAKTAWMVGLGAMTADTIFAMLIVGGFTRFAGNPALRIPLFAAGAIMLAYVGWSSLTLAIHNHIDLTGRARKSSHAYTTGFLMAAFNPMGIVYWLSVGSALVAEAVARVGRLGSPVLVGGVFLGIFCWVSGLAIAVHVGRRYVNERALRWITGIGGAILLGFACWFALQAFNSFRSM